MSATGSGRRGLVFLGCGKAAAAHARVLRRLAPGLGLSFASRDLARAEDLRRRFRGARAYDSYEAAIGASEVGTVVVTTPPDGHLALVLSALEADKDVVVEKPAFPVPEDFPTVRRAAASAGRRVLVAENYFYKPVRRRLADMIAAGAVGTPLFVRLNGVKRQVPEGWRADRTVAGGGLLEGGVHWVNFMANLGLGESRVRGFRAGSATSGTEESLMLVFDFDSGCVGTLAFSWEVPSPLQGLRLSTVYGREGSIWFESNGIFLVSRGRRRAVSLLPGGSDLGGFRTMWTDFLASLGGEKEPEMTLDLAERDVRQVHQAYEADA